MSKQSKPVVVITGELAKTAKSIGAAIRAAEKTAVTLGTLAREAAPMIKNAETLDAFVKECRVQCGKNVSESSVKTYMSMIRGVLRHAVAGNEIPEGESIKAMYSEAKKGTGANKGGKPRTVKTETREEKPAARTMTLADAALFVFGHADDELVAALEWAKQNEMAFLRYVKANVEASTKPVTTKPAAKPRQRKAA